MTFIHSFVLALSFWCDKFKLVISAYSRPSTKFIKLNLSFSKMSHHTRKTGSLFVVASYISLSSNLSNLRFHWLVLRSHCISYLVKCIDQVQLEILIRMWDIIFSWKIKKNDVCNFYSMPCLCNELLIDVLYDKF